jgi:uncharacterized Fe-S cluster-containing radical SAM superfamily protein
VQLNKIAPKERHNYVAFFLTLGCNLTCDYCINRHNNNQGLPSGKHMSADNWITAANRLVLREDLPLTLQGGEPTLHKDFFRIVNEVNPEIKMDIMTNMMFDVDAFISNVPAWRFIRKAPYAAIRVSYHPGQNNIDDLIKKTIRLQEAGFQIGLYGIEHPNEEIRTHILSVREQCLVMGLDFRLKEFLGEYNGKMYGTFKFENCVNGNSLSSCICRTSEIIVDPAGHVYKCHADLYHARNPIAHILDEGFSEETIDEFRECDFYGSCNPCDVKVKTNRFQVYGHTSVEILNIQ